MLHCASFAPDGTMSGRRLSCCCAVCMGAAQGMCVHEPYVGYWQPCQLQAMRGVVADGGEEEEGALVEEAGEQQGGMGALVLALPAGAWAAVTAGAAGVEGAAYALVHIIIHY